MPQPGDKVLIKSGQHAGRTGILVKLNTRSDSSGASYTAWVQLDGGSKVGPLNAKNLEPIPESAEPDE
jgi:hypothetical protein